MHSFLNKEFKDQNNRYKKLYQKTQKKKYMNINSFTCNLNN